MSFVLPTLGYLTGATGTTTQVLHGNGSSAPTYSAVNLATDVTGTLATGNIDATLHSKTLDDCFVSSLSVGFGAGGTSTLLVYDPSTYHIDGRDITSQPIREYEGGTNNTGYTGGNILVGKNDGTLAKTFLTGATGVTITNGDGTITIGVTGIGGSAPTTEYDNPSGNPYTYNIPSGSKFLDIVLIGAGGGGGGGSLSPANPGAGGGGGAGIYRSLRIPVESGVTTATVTIGTGGTGGAIGANGSAGTQSTVVINSKTIYAAAGGGGSNGGSGRSGGGGGSGGAANGGSAVSTATAGSAGSATPPANTHYTIGIAGVAGSNGQTAGTSIAPPSPGALTNNSYIIGGAGTGPGSYQGSSAVGGDCQGGIYQTPSTSGLHGAGTNCTGGGNGGSSGKALGGRGAYYSSFTRTDATAGTYGSGGGGGLGSNIAQASAGASGGNGFASITPVF